MYLLNVWKVFSLRQRHNSVKIILHLFIPFPLMMASRAVELLLPGRFLNTSLFAHLNNTWKKSQTGSQNIKIHSAENARDYNNLILIVGCHVWDFQFLLCNYTSPWNRRRSLQQSCNIFFFPFWLAALCRLQYFSLLHLVIGEWSD